MILSLESRINDKNLKYVLFEFYTESSSKENGK